MPLTNTGQNVHFTTCAFLRLINSSASLATVNRVRIIYPGDWPWFTGRWMRQVCTPVQNIAYVNFLHTKIKQTVTSRTSDTLNQWALP